MILNSISNPDDLKKIAPEFLPEICGQIREAIIETVSRTGGHLAPSLGVVELTVALHYVFDSPSDKIVWDVGHQAYAHKILTGRRDRFHTLRQKGGISGFPNVTESPYDTFGTGHASTSISAALGIARALQKKRSTSKAIAVIGDGSMSGGLAFEALNQAGHKPVNLIVILNDNEMSISPNVGAVSRFLSMHIHGKTAGRIKKHLRKLLLLVPIWGKSLYKISQKAEEATLGFFTPGAIFEAFGFNYIGPIDGHNIDDMVRVFKGVRDTPTYDQPLLIHVLTKKGKGYGPAETDPTLFHGLGPFDRATGKPVKNSSTTFTKAFGSSLVKLAKDDSSIVAITAAMTTGTGLSEFADKYPDRFYDVGIAEGHAVTFAAGLAMEGLRPVVAIYSTFLQRAYDHVVHDVCLQNLPVTFALDRAGVVGDDGPTHHGAFDLTYLRSIPNLTVLAPRSAGQLGKMLRFATRHNGPVAIRYPRGTAADEAVELSLPYEPGRAEVVWRGEKPSVAVWAAGHLVSEAVRAAEMLAREGIDIIVADPCSIKPIDFGLLRKHFSKYGSIVTVEENVLTGGFGSAIGEWLAAENMPSARLKSLGLRDQFIEHSPQKDLRARYGIDADGIVRAVREIVRETTLEAFSKDKIEDVRAKDPFVDRDVEHIV